MQTTNSKKRLAFVEIYYAIAAVCIVFYHSRMMHADNAVIITTINSFLSCFQVPLFFFIAGILFSYTYRDDRDWKKWSIDKFVKLYIPYIILCSLAFFPKRIYYGLINADSKLSYRNFFVSLIKPINSMWGHLWFIPVYLIMMILLMLYWRSIKSKTVHYIVLSIAAVASLLPINCEWLGIRDICIETFWLLLGVEISNWLISKACSKQRDEKNIIAIATCIVIAVLLFTIRDTMETPLLVDRLMVKVITVLMITVILFMSVYISGGGYNRTR